MAAAAKPWARATRGPVVRDRGSRQNGLGRSKGTTAAGQGVVATHQLAWGPQALSADGWWRRCDDAVPESSVEGTGLRFQLRGQSGETSPPSSHASSSPSKPTMTRLVTALLLPIWLCYGQCATADRRDRTDPSVTNWSSDSQRPHRGTAGWEYIYDALCTDRWRRPGPSRWCDLSRPERVIPRRPVGGSGCESRSGCGAGARVRGSRRDGR